MKYKMKHKFSIFLFLISFVVEPAIGDSDSIMVHEPWIREAPPGTPMAGYLVLHNHGDTKRNFIGVTSDSFGHIMLHRSYHEDGVVKMEHLESVTLEPEQKVQFEPGGLHLMLMSPARSLEAGEIVSLDLKFGDGSTKTVDFMVMPVGGEPSENHNHEEGD